MKPSIKYISESEAVEMVGKGWEQLVRKIYNAKIGLGIPVGIIQVKEKFGTLRFYYRGGDEYVRGVVDMAENMSSITCEACGNPGECIDGGWIRTLCEEHVMKKI